MTRLKSLIFYFNRIFFGSDITILTSSVSEFSVRDSDIMISRDSEIHALAAPRQAVEA